MCTFKMIIFFLFLSPSPNLITTKATHSQLQAARSTGRGAPCPNLLKKMHSVKKPSGQGMREGFPAWISSKESATKFDLMVAKDGSGNFTSINDAVAAAPNNSKTRFVIDIKEGVFRVCHGGQHEDQPHVLGAATRGNS